MIPNPILRVLSALYTSGARFLLMGGQACVFYGATELSRDVDIAVAADPAAGVRAGDRRDTRHPSGAPLTDDSPRIAVIARKPPGSHHPCLLRSYGLPAAMVPIPTSSAMRGPIGTVFGAPR